MATQTSDSVNDSNNFNNGFGLVGLVGLSDITRGRRGDDCDCSNEFKHIQFTHTNKNVTDGTKENLVGLNFLGNNMTSQFQNLGDKVVNAAFINNTAIKEVGNDVFKEACMTRELVQSESWKTNQNISDKTCEIKGLILEVEGRDKDRRLAEKDAAILALQNENALNLRVGPPGVGAFITSVRPDFCGDKHSNEQINIINQNVNAIGSTVIQLADALNKIASKVMA